MQSTQFSLRNPLVVGLLTSVMCCFGLYSFLSLGIGITPNVSFPLVVVRTTYTGADPATVETKVTKPIEDAVATVQNVDTITSTSSEGTSIVNIQFTAAADSKLTSVDVERVINSIRSTLPADADASSITKAEISAFPVVTVALSGPQTLLALQQVGTDTVQRAFEAVPGVQAVAVSGGATREIHVELDLKKLQSYGLGINTVQQALQNEQVQIPAGLLTDQGKDVSVRLNALVPQPAQLGQITVATTPTGTVHLSDVATVVDSIKTTQVINRVNGVPAVTIRATKAVSGNTIAVSRGVRQAMAQLAPELPQGMQMAVVSDAAVYTQQSYDTIRTTLGEAILFTGVILLLFLHTWRSTMIVLAAIPTSLLTTFALMNVLGLGLDLFSMLAVTLAVGILVDDSIVILENIYRHLGLGEPPLLAALNGRTEIGLAAITITAVDVAVYVPIALIPGIAGDFIRPFAVVIACATLTSLAVSFTLTPLLASRFLNLERAPQQRGGAFAAFGRRWDAGFAALARGYRSVLDSVIHGKVLLVPMRVVVIAFGLLTFVIGLALPLTGHIGLDIFPSGDQSEIDVTLTMPPATTLATTGAIVRQMEGKLKGIPEVREVYSNTGGASGGGPAGANSPSGNASRLTVLLVPIQQRQRTSTQISNQLVQLLDPQIPHAQLEVSLPNAFGFGGFGGQPIQISVRGPNPDVLNHLVDQVTAAAQAAPGAVNVNNANQQVQPDDVIILNRSQASDLGVTAQAAGSVLRTAIGGTVVAQYQQSGQDSVDIRLLTNSAFVATPANLTTLPILSNTGALVQLGQIGSVVSSTAPTVITHDNRERSVTINASASGRLASDVQTEIQNRIARISLPPGYSITFGGQAQTSSGAFTDIFKALAVGVVIIYVLMAMLFGSLTLPLAVLMSLPLAMVGALGAMTLTGTPFTLFSLLGFAVLLGLVDKNAILLVDYTDTLRRRGYSRTEALLEAGPTRLRPILMTTMSIIVALAPLVMGFASGSELLKAAAIVLMGGLLTSTLLTLVFVPAMYTVFDDLQDAVLRMVHRFAVPRALTAEEDHFMHPGRHLALPAQNGVVHATPVAAGGGGGEASALGS